MSPQNTLHISFVVSAAEHNKAVIEDLWTRAAAAVDKTEWEVSGTAICVGLSGVLPAVPGRKLGLITMDGLRSARLEQIGVSLATRPGPAGIAGRLLRDNLQSRSMARAVAVRKDVLAALTAADIVVSGGDVCDRAVWQLRKRTQAGLVHGPVAMVHAIRALTRT